MFLDKSPSAHLLKMALKAFFDQVRIQFFEQIIEDIDAGTPLFSLTQVEHTLDKSLR